MTLKIKKWVPPESQLSKLDNKQWSVSRLFELSKNFEVMEVPLNHLSIFYIYERLTLREMVMHMQAVNDADLSMPIILDENGDIMDGRHRIMKALLIGVKTIKAVRFEENPTPCRIDE